MKVLYFSATGNSLYVAKKIGGDLLSIPQLYKNGMFAIEDDAVGVVCPVYCGEMPKMVRVFLEKATIKTDYFFFVFTYGMSETVARFHAQSLADRTGLRLDYADAVIMVDNYLPGFEMKEQLETLPKKNVENSIARVAMNIAARKRQTVKVSALKKAEMAMVHKAMGKRILSSDTAKSYIVSDSCVLCGTCEKVCPAGNIRVTDKVSFGNQCEVCYACLHNCPAGAIHLKNEKSSVRFRNEKISLEELIKANSQGLPKAEAEA